MPSIIEIYLITKKYENPIDFIEKKGNICIFNYLRHLAWYESCCVHHWFQKLYELLIEDEEPTKLKFMTENSSLWPHILFEGGLKNYLFVRMNHLYIFK